MEQISGKIGKVKAYCCLIVSLYTAVLHKEAALRTHVAK